MIRFSITLEALHRLIEEEKPGWGDRAADLTKSPYNPETNKLRSGIWSEIKAVYMRLQHNKCGYCERLLESERYGKIEHDVEHFRPKSAVTKWPTRAIKQERDLDYDFPTGNASARGYLKLWHHPFNFLTSCKPCNTPLKSCYFPIEGRRNTRAGDPMHQPGERALLVYPLGDFDENPEDLIDFYGHLAIAKGPVGTRQHRRAMVTIDFFELNRHTLQSQRADVITHLDVAFRLLANGNDEDRIDANEDIKRLCRNESHHAACARAYCRRYTSNPTEARKLAQAARMFLTPN